MNNMHMALEAVLLKYLFHFMQSTGLEAQSWLKGTALYILETPPKWPKRKKNGVFAHRTNDRDDMPMIAR